MTLSTMLRETCRGAYIFPQTEHIVPVTAAGLAEETKLTINVDISEDYFGGAEELNATDIRAAIEDGLRGLLLGQGMSSEIQAKLIEQLHKPLGRNLFAAALEQFNKQTPFGHWDSFRTLAELVSNLLTAFVLEKDYNYKTLHVVLSAGRNIYAKVSKPL